MQIIYNSPLSMSSLNIYANIFKKFAGICKTCKHVLLEFCCLVVGLGVNRLNAIGTDLVSLLCLCLVETSICCFRCMCRDDVRPRRKTRIGTTKINTNIANRL